MRVILMFMVLVFTFLSYNDASALIYKVAKNKGLHKAAYSTIQEAIDACDDKGNTVLVMDNEVYEEMVTINERKNIKLVSQSYIDDPYAVNNRNKPTIKFCDTEHVYPLSFDDYDSKGKNNFQSNGAIRIIRSSNIEVLGFNVDGDDGKRGVNSDAKGVEDGDELFPSENLYNDVVVKRTGAAGGLGWRTGPVWSNQYKITYGNIGIILHRSRNVAVKGCHIYNNFSGITFFDRSPDGIYGRGVGEGIPVSNPLSEGNHVIQNNHIFDNARGITVEFAWALGSTIKHNLIYDNYMRFTLGSANDGFVENYDGGAFAFAETIDPQWHIFNNTLYHNTYVTGNQYTNWRMGKNFILSNNLVAEPINKKGYSESITLFSLLYNNLFEVQYQDPVRIFFNGGFADSHGNWSGPDALAKDYVSPVMFNQWGGTILWGGVSVANGGEIDVNMANGEVEKVTLGNIFPDAKIITTGVGNIEEKNNYWLTTAYTQNKVTDGDTVTSTEYYRPSVFISTDRESNDFLMPQYDDKGVRKRVQDASRAESGVYDADGTIADIGALCILQNNGLRSWTGEYPGPKLKIIDGNMALVDTTAGEAEIVFNLKVIDGTDDEITNLKYEMVMYYQDLPHLGENDNISATFVQEPITLTLSGTPTIGGNKITIKDVPTPGFYAIFQVIITGEDKFGNQIYSNRGIFPYRKYSETTTAAYDIPIEYFDVSIHKDGEIVTEISAGDTVFLVVDGGTFSAADTSFTIKTNSGKNLNIPSGEELKKWPGDFANKDSVQVVFTEMGTQIVTVASGNNMRVMVGHSNSILVTSNTAAKSRFYDPPSAKSMSEQSGAVITRISKNSNMNITLELLDYLDNRVQSSKDSIFSIDVKVDGKHGTLSEEKVFVNKKGFATVNLTAIGAVGDTFAVYSRMTSKDDWQDITWMLTTDPIEIVYFSPLERVQNVNEMIPIRVFVSLDGVKLVDNVDLPQVAIIRTSIPTEFKFFYDEAGVNQIDVANPFALVGNDDTIYVTSSIPVDPTLIKFQLVKNSADLLINQPASVEFVLPPIVSVFTTYSNNSSDVTSIARAFSYKDSLFNLYAWGYGEDGNIYPITVNWSGIGVFDGMDIAQSHLIQIKISDAMKSKSGMFAIDYIADEHLQDTTALITIIGDIDRIFIIDKKDYDSSLTIPQIESLEHKISDTLSWALGDSVNIFSIGVDDSLKQWFVMSLDWSSSNLQPYDFIDTTSTSSATYSHLIHIDSLSAVGAVSISLTSVNRVGKSIEKSVNYKVYDPVDNLNITLFSNFAEDNRVPFFYSQNGDTTRTEYFKVEKTGSFISESYWQKPDGSKLNCSTNWSIESKVVKTDAIYNGAKGSGSSYALTGITSIDIVEITITRGTLSLTAYILFFDAIQYGIYPNPINATMFSDESTKPTIKVVLEGVMSSILVKIYDGNGNIVVVLDDLMKDVPNIADTTTTKSGSSLKTLIPYEFTSWDGKTESGETLNTGSYFIVFDLEMKDSDGVISQKRVFDKFYYIK